MADDTLVPIDLFIEAFGQIGATVIRPAPANDPIAADGFWLPYISDTEPGGSGLQRRAMRKIFVLSRADVPTLPIGTRIMVPEELGEPVRSYEVEAIEYEDSEHYRAVLLRVEE